MLDDDNKDQEVQKIPILSNGLDRKFFGPFQVGSSDVVCHCCHDIRDCSCLEFTVLLNIGIDSVDKILKVNAREQRLICAACEVQAANVDENG